MRCDRCGQVRGPLHRFAENVAALHVLLDHPGVTEEDCPRCAEVAGLEGRLLCHECYSDERRWKLLWLVGKPGGAALGL